MNSPITSINPGLEKVFELFEKKLKQDICCAKIGKIQSYDSSTQTASVQITFKRQRWDGTVVAYPILVGCPIYRAQGGGIGVQFPIATGDECLLIFSDSDIDNWYTYGTDSVPNSARTHDLSDAIAVVGRNSLQNKLALWLTASEGGLADISSKVAISGGKVTVANTSQNLLTVLENLITAIKAITTTNCVVGSPVSVSTASQTQLHNIVTELEALLY